MVCSAHDVVDIFKSNAAKVGTTVIEVKNLEQAAAYALDLCLRGPARENRKILAVPGLPDQVVSPLLTWAEKNGVRIVRENLRSCLKSISVSLTRGDMAIADTASVIMSSYDEDPRLASMLGEIHVIAVPRSKVVPSSDEAENYLREALSGAMYTSFISGCSRTSDIERVLTLGVHGPLELHVVLTEEE